MAFCHCSLCHMLSLSNVPTGKARFGCTVHLSPGAAGPSGCRANGCLGGGSSPPTLENPWHTTPSAQHFSTATILMRKPQCGSVRTQKESEWWGQWVTALSDERKAVTEPSVTGTLGHNPSLLGCSPAWLLPLRTCLSLGLSLLLVTACDHMQCDPSLWL